MTKYESTRYGTNGENATTLMYAAEHVLIDNVRPVPPMYPDTRPGVSHVVVAHEVEAFQAGVDELVDHLVEDEQRTVIDRAASARFTLAEVIEVVGLAAASGQDLYDADARFDFCLRFLGLDPAAYRAELGDASPLGGL